jgi:hypothetical protein
MQSLKSAHLRLIEQQLTKLRPDLPELRFMKAITELELILGKVPDKDGPSYRFYKDVVELLKIALVNHTQFESLILIAEQQKAIINGFMEHFNEMAREVQAVRAVKDAMLEQKEYTLYKDILKERYDEIIADVLASKSK